MIITFINPTNGYSEDYNTSSAPVWCLLFGFIYWIVRGNVKHTAISLILAICTSCISWFIYPFFANKINIATYGKRGWVRKDQLTAPLAAPVVNQPPIQTIVIQQNKNEKFRHNVSKVFVFIILVIGIKLLIDKHDLMGKNQGRKRR